MLQHVTDLPLNKKNAHVFSYPGLTHWNPVQGQLPRTLARPILSMRKQEVDAQLAKWIAGKRKQPRSGHLTLSLFGQLIEGMMGRY